MGKFEGISVGNVSFLIFACCYLLQDKPWGPMCPGPFYVVMYGLPDCLEEKHIRPLAERLEGYVNAYIYGPHINYYSRFALFRFSCLNSAHPPSPWNTAMQNIYLSYYHHAMLCRIGSFFPWGQRRACKPRESMTKAQDRV
jgi:hypothetical protein